MTIHCGGDEIQETGQMGEETDDRTGQPAMLPSGEHASACSLASYAGGRVRELNRSLNKSGCPSSLDNDKRGGS